MDSVTVEKGGRRGDLVNSGLTQAGWLSAELQVHAGLRSNIMQGEVAEQWRPPAPLCWLSTLKTSVTRHWGLPQG